MFVVKSHIMANGSWVLQNILSHFYVYKYNNKKFQNLCVCEKKFLKENVLLDTFISFIYSS